MSFDKEKRYLIYAHDKNSKALWKGRDVAYSYDTSRCVGSKEYHYSSPSLQEDLKILVKPLYSFKSRPQCEADEKFLRSQINAKYKCQKDEDCALLAPGCPLSCGVAVNSNISKFLKTEFDNHYNCNPKCYYKCPIYKKSFCNEDNICQISEKAD